MGLDLSQEEIAYFGILLDEQMNRHWLLAWEWQDELKPDEYSDEYLKEVQEIIDWNKNEYLRLEKLQDRLIKILKENNGD